MAINPPCILHPKFTTENPFPALPPINDEHIETRVFTHRSYFARPNHVFEDDLDDPSPDNEKYEHLGDTVLGLVVTNLLLEVYPNLHVGPSTKIRALVVGNATLADISRRYGLPARLTLHQAQAITLRASTNIQADVFESYVGGLYLEQGLPGVQPWLKALFAPYTTEAYTLVRKEHGLSPPPPPPVAPPMAASTSTSSDSSGTSTNAAVPTSESDASTDSTGPTSKTTAPTSRRAPVQSRPPATGTPTTTGHLALFNQQVQKSQCEVEWVYTDGVGEGTRTTPIWVVRVEVDGVVFGSGKGGTKKAARNEAAKEGLVRMGIVV
ncbi:ribonuclease III [Phlebopus sp. FC_14]|nr:ribonuclease III [Phlebopus sp. FC_14]